MAQRRAKGDRFTGIPTDDWNEFVAAANARKAEGYRSSPVRRTNSKGQGATLIVRNNTGGDLTADHPVLKLGEPVVGPAGRASLTFQVPRVQGESPAGPGDRVAILQGPVAAGKDRVAIATGMTWVDVDVTNSSHNYANPASSDAEKLASSGSEGLAEILYKPVGTGTLRCLVLIGSGSGGSQQGTGLITAAGTAASYDETTVTLTFDEDVELRKFRTNPTSATLKSVEEPIDACNDSDEAITLAASKARLCFWHVDAFGRTCVEPSCNEVDWDGTTPSITTGAAQNAPENSTATIVTLAASSVIGDKFWSISGGTDAAHFTINESTGALAFSEAKDYEDPDDANTDGAYQVTVKVVAGNGEVDTLAMTITLTDVAE